MTGRLHRTAAAGVLAGLLVLVACTGAPVEPGASGSPEPTSPTSPVLFTDTAEAALAAAVQIRTDGCRGRTSRGGGAVVAPDRVITVAHVVAGTSEIEVTLSTGVTEPGVVVAINRANDLALIAVDTSGVTPLPLRDATAATSGHLVVERDDEVTAAPFATVRYVGIRADSIDRDERTRRLGYELDAKIEPGDSGTVIVAADGAAGVVFARSRRTPGRAWATAASEVRALLDDSDGDAVDVGDCAR